MPRLACGEALAGQGQEFALGGLARLGRGSIGHDAQRQVRVGMQSDDAPQVLQRKATQAPYRGRRFRRWRSGAPGRRSSGRPSAVRCDRARARRGAIRAPPRTGSWVLLLLRGSTPKTWIVICSGSTDRCGGGAPRRHRRPARTRRPGTGGEGRRSRLRPGFDQAAGAQHKFFLQVGDALGAGAAVEIPLAPGRPLTPAASRGPISHWKVSAHQSRGFAEGFFGAAGEEVAEDAEDVGVGGLVGGDGDDSKPRCGIDGARGGGCGAAQLGKSQA